MQITNEGIRYDNTNAKGSIKFARFYKKGTRYLMDIGFNYYVRSQPVKVYTYKNLPPFQFALCHLFAMHNQFSKLDYHLHRMREANRQQNPTNQLKGVKS